MADDAHREEQAMEMEALEAILMEDLVAYEGNTPSGWKLPDGIPVYKVTITPAEEEGADDDEEDISTSVLAELLFAHTPRYPDEGPLLRLRSVRGLSDASLAEGTRMLEGLVQENLGMAMVYTLVTAAKEWLRSKASGTGENSMDPAVAAKKAADEEEAKRAAARAHGTPVSIAVFQQWKASFDAEVAAVRAKAAAEQARDDEKARRISGKAYFIKQALEQIGADGEEEAELDDDEEYESEEEEEGMQEVGEEDEESEDFDDDEDDGVLEAYLAAKQ